MIAKIFILFTFLTLCLGFIDKGSTLGDGQALNDDEYLSACTGYSAMMRADGNFILYYNRHFVPRNTLWSTQTGGNITAPSKLVMQSDGNLVIYDK
jgi:hypothetical protein